MSKGQTFTELSVQEVSVCESFSNRERALMATLRRIMCWCVEE